MNKENKIKCAPLSDSLINVSNDNLRNVPVLKYVCQICDKIGPSIEREILGQYLEDIKTAGYDETGMQVFESRENVNMYGNQVAKLSVWPKYFVKRYLDNEVSTRNPSLYLECKEIQEMLCESFSDPIDVSAYWYLCLWIRDFVDNAITISKFKSLNMRNQLLSFADDSIKASSTNDAYIEIHTGKGRKPNIKIDNKILLEAIGLMVKKGTEENILSIPQLGLNSRSNNENEEPLSQHQKIGLFILLMEEFLEVYTAKRRKLGAKSNAKLRLISMSIYSIGLSDNKMICNGDKLKNNYTRFANDIYAYENRVYQMDWNL